MYLWWQAQDATPSDSIPEQAATDETGGDTQQAGETQVAGDEAAVTDQAPADTGTDVAPEVATESGEVAGETLQEIPGEVKVVPDAAEALGGTAETIRETLVGDRPDDVTDTGFLGVSGIEWTWGISSLVVALIIRVFVLWLMNRYLQPIVEKTETDYDDRVLAQLHRAVGIFILIGGFFLAFTFIRLPGDWQTFVWRVLHTLIIISVGLLAYRIAEIFLHFVSHGVGQRVKSVMDEQLFPLTRDIIKFVTIILVIVAIVQSWGYSAAGLLTGVGIGGLALAFAAQDTVANIFGSFMIFADRPYKVGDWVKFGGVEGTVEEIGVRTTRIRCFDKTIVLVPNKTITNENIQNFSQMPIRRIKVYVGLSYESSPEQIRRVVEQTRELLANNVAIDQTFWMVNFTEMATSSLDMLVYCFTKTTIWKEYMEVRQDLLLRIIEICRNNGVDIAFPSRTIYHKNADVHPYAGYPRELQRGTTEDLPPELRRSGKTPDRRAEFETAEGEDG